MFKLSYTAQLVQTDGQGNPIGDVYTVRGSQNIASNAPQAGDITGAATAGGTDIGAQMAAIYPIQAIENSDNGGAGGQG